MIYLQNALKLTKKLFFYEKLFGDFPYKDMSNSDE